MIVQKGNKPWFRMFIEVTSVVTIVIRRGSMKARQKGTFKRVNSLAFKIGKPKRNFSFWDFVKPRRDVCPVKETGVVKCSKLIKKKYVMMTKLLFKNRVFGMGSKN